jgi:hypothetical protein
MSENVEIKENEKKIDALASKVLSGFKGFFDSADAPWSYSATVIDFIKDYFDNYNDKDLISFLTEISGVNYNEFNKDWNSLSEEQKKKAIDIIISDIAELGLESLFMAIANAWEVYDYSDVRLRIMKVAKDYLNNKIDFSNMAFEIENIFWPNEKIKEKEKDDIDNYWKGIELIDYIPISKALELVQKYLINEIDAIGKNLNLGEPAP